MNILLSTMNTYAYYGGMYCNNGIILKGTVYLKCIPIHLWRNLLQKWHRTKGQRLIAMHTNTYSGGMYCNNDIILKGTDHLLSIPTKTIVKSIAKMISYPRGQFICYVCLCIQHHTRRHSSLAYIWMLISAMTIYILDIIFWIPSQCQYSTDLANIFGFGYEILGPLLTLYT